jgi:hypothetical protein
LDVWVGQVGSGTQIAAYDPGIIPASPDGLVWTVALPDDSVRLLDEGPNDEDTRGGRCIARMHVTGLELFDSTTNANSVKHDVDGGAFDPPRVPGTISSLDICWRTRVRTRDEQNQFEGVFQECVVDFSWSAETPDHNFQYVSDPGNTAVTLFALVGSERNGAFFR